MAVLKASLLIEALGSIILKTNLELVSLVGFEDLLLVLTPHACVIPFSVPTHGPPVEPSPKGSKR